MGASLRPGEIERGKASARQLSEPRDLPRPGDHYDLDGLCLSNALQLRGCHWRLIENHRVGLSCEIGLRHPNVLVIIVIPECAQSLTSALGADSIASHDYCRWRVQVIE
jgi:hypothetical protein